MCNSETIGWPADMPSPIKDYHALYQNMVSLPMLTSDARCLGRPGRWSADASFLRQAMICDPDGYWLELVPRVLPKH